MGRQDTLGPGVIITQSWWGRCFSSVFTGGFWKAGWSSEMSGTANSTLMAVVSGSLCSTHASAPG